MRPRTAFNPRAIHLYRLRHRGQRPYRLWMNSLRRSPVHPRLDHLPPRTAHPLLCVPTPLHPHSPRPQARLILRPRLQPSFSLLLALERTRI